MVACRWSAALVAVCLLGALFGCARDVSDDETIEDTVGTFLQAVGRDGEEACGQLTGDARGTLVSHADKTPCPRAAESIPAELSPEVVLFLYDFDAVRFRGTLKTQAEVPPVDLGDPIIKEFVPPIPLVKTEDGWRITALTWFFESQL
jgi:hypothetical protein